ncbi:uncharacterized protein A4U43_C07F21600 [Asparagus officinalis]|uniref:PAR1 protein n=1 Tax=Asparagus officinalis TaxID=4686 RepID=A0A5P1EDX2_ASPOF|nr:uncharacterized protein LOC109849443 [Asparagus officinalis]ONK64052.1 uncharacterized protein A4U43_C07F21600 [Asparagus officinalis]
MATSSKSNPTSYFTFFLILFFSYASCALGEVVCEKLDQSTCAYSVSSSGMRCVLEKHAQRGGREKHVCRASEIEAKRFRGWIEKDECVEACGLDRTSLGISSDSLLEARFTEKLCSAQCSGGCPNILHLYFNLAAAEGVFLPKLCEARQANPRRAMAEIRSSGLALAPAGPTSGEVFVASSPPSEPPM